LRMLDMEGVSIIGGLNFGRMIDDKCRDI
jgi:hypothetical protein